MVLSWVRISFNYGNFPKESPRLSCLKETSAEADTVIFMILHEHCTAKSITVGFERIFL